MSGVRDARLTPGVVPRLSATRDYRRPVPGGPRQHPRVASDEQIIAGGVDVAVTGTSRTTICPIHLAQSGGPATDSEGRDTACFDLVDSVEVSLVGMYREEGGILRDRCTGTANDRNGFVR